MKVTRLFVLLALAALLAPPAEASRSSVWGSNPPSSIVRAKPDAASALASLAPAARLDASALPNAEAAEPPLFNLGDVILADTADADAEHFDLGPLTLVDLNLLRGPPSSYPETRVGGFELLPPFSVGASASLSLWGRQACGFSCREVASDSRYDPWGLAADISSGRQYGEMRRYGTPEDVIAAQRAADQAAIETGVRVDLALAALAVPAARVWQAIRTLPEIWTLGASGWLHRNAPAVRRAAEEVVELANEGPSIVPHAPPAEAVPERKLLTAAGETDRTLRQVQNHRGTGQERGTAYDQYLAQHRRGESQVAVDTQLGVRIHDARVPTGTVTDLAVEGKNYLRYRTVEGAVVEGSVPLSAEIKKQIYKDVLWIRQGKKEGLHRVVQWEFAGAPPNEQLARFLERWGLPYVHPPGK